MIVNLLHIPVYYINLDKDTDRLTYIEKQLSELNFLKYKKIEAIDGNNYKNKINAPNISSADIGCTMSHMKALEEFLGSNNDLAIVCEDDADFSNLKNTNIKVEIDVNSMHSNNGLADFCLQLAVLSREEMPINFELHERSFWDFGTTVYLVNRKYAETMIEYYGCHLNINWHKFIEKEVSDPRGGTVKTRPVADELVYSLTKTLCYPIFTFKDFKSTINTNYEQQIQIKTSIEKFNSHWKVEK